MYKSHVLSYLEYRTPARYHAATTHLADIDGLQTSILRNLGITEYDALMAFNLAPLCSRRDMAMLGVIHRTILGKGPPHFKEHFKLKANGRIADPREEIGGRLIACDLVFSRICRL